MRCGLLVWAVAAITASVGVADELPPGPLRVAPLGPVELRPQPGTDTPQPSEKPTPAPAPAPAAPAPQANAGPALCAPLWPCAPGAVSPGAGPCPPAGLCGDVAERRPGWIRHGPVLYWLSDAPLPTLVATGPLGPGTQVLLGDDRVDYGMFTGYFVEGGWWLGGGRNLGFELGGFYAPRRTVTQQVTSDLAGNPLLARPFFNPQMGPGGGQDAFLISAPGRYSGALAVETGAQLAGAEANFLVNLANRPSWTVDFVAGARYFDLDESLTVTQYTQALPGNLIPFFGTAPGVSSVVVTDRFRTRNQFWGGQMGLECETRFDMFFVDGGAKVGLGPVHQVTEVSGQTLAPGVAAGPGGILATGQIPNGNIGRTTTDRFAVLADAHGQVGVMLGARARLGVGYQFIYLNSVARPGHQVVTAVDPRLVPIAPGFGTRIPTNAPGGPGTPPVTPVDRGDVVLHGIRFSFAFVY